MPPPDLPPGTPYSQDYFSADWGVCALCQAVVTQGELTFVDVDVVGNKQLVCAECAS